MVLEIKGDIRETPIRTIAHGVNCQGVMGSGVARALFEKWPEVREHYIQFHEQQRKKGKIDKDFLGFNQTVPASKKIIINMHTQLNFGSGDSQYVDYAAVLRCFDSLKYDFGSHDRILAVPRIGAGLAGGDWETIKNIMVSKTQEQNIDLVIYSLTSDKK